MTTQLLLYSFDNYQLRSQQLKPSRSCFLRQQVTVYIHHPVWGCTLHNPHTHPLWSGIETMGAQSNAQLIQKRHSSSLRSCHRGGTPPRFQVNSAVV